MTIFKRNIYDEKWQLSYIYQSMMTNDNLNDIYDEKLQLKLHLWWQMTI